MTKKKKTSNKELAARRESVDIEPGRGQREAVERERRRHGAPDQRVVARRPCRLPVAGGHEDLWALPGRDIIDNVLFSKKCERRRVVQRRSTMAKALTLKESFR